MNEERDQPPITLDQMFEMAAALKRHRALDYWPPRSLRGSIRECHDHGTRHWHWEAVCELRGGIVAHYFDLEHYGSPEVAAGVLHQFAAKAGHPDFALQPHEEFAHSTGPEVRRMEQDEEEGEA